MQGVIVDTKKTLNHLEVFNTTFCITLILLLFNFQKIKKQIKSKLIQNRQSFEKWFFNKE